MNDVASPVDCVHYHMLAVAQMTAYGDDSPVVVMAPAYHDAHERLTSLNFYDYVVRAYQAAGITPEQSHEITSARMAGILSDADTLFRADLATAGLNIGGIVTVYTPALGMAYVPEAEAQAWIDHYLAHGYPSMRLIEGAAYWERKTCATQTVQ